MSDGWTRLDPGTFVNPVMMSRLKRRMMDGTVREDGHVDVEGDEVLKQDTEDPMEPGTEVVVRLRGGDIYARPMAEQRRVERGVKRRHELKERASDRVKDWKQNRAREFWKRYDIPFEWDVAIKGRRSGLSRGSWGDGRAADTVEHLFVRESFSEGRLSRSADVYLCDDSADIRFTEGVRRQNSEGESYIPPVTCSTCLERMERWLDADSGGE